nr:hypothetical protein [uncultured Marinifilum sp.]
MKQKKCLYCKEPFVGRADKKFCNSQCKSAYHNQTSQSCESYIRLTNKQLRANRRALRKACPSGKATVRKSFLKKLGMDFKHLTHTWKSKSGILYYFCYDYGYTASIEPEKVMIIQQQDYMN